MLLNLDAFIACLDAGLDGNAVGRGARGIAPGMAERAAAELEAGIVAEDRDQRRHVPDVDAARRHRHNRRHGAEVLVEEDAARPVLGDEALTHEIDPSERRLAVALQLADDGSRMQVIAAR